MLTNQTFQTFSFGCRVNEAEKEEIDRKLLLLGYQKDDINPSIYIVNTCSVTQKAEREARQLIFQIRKKYPKTQLVITGCSATYWKKNNVYKDLPVDHIIDNIQKDYLVQILQKRLKISNNIHKIHPNPSSKFLDSGRMMIKIQDGCQRFCTYCIVPYLRGNPQSYKIKDIVKKINKNPQVKEIILAAINTEEFEVNSDEEFIDLIKTVILNTHVPRISFGSVHPWSITNEFMDLYKAEMNSKNKRIVDFFHIPLQSGSDKILRLMKREYTSSEMFDKLNKLQKINPMALIATDIIVGFLEETDKDFEDTYYFLEKAPINKFHIFRFSKRQNTAAYFLAKQLKEPTNSQKKKRAISLAELGLKKYHSFLEKRIDKNFSGLFINNFESSYQEVLLNNQISAWIKIDKRLHAEIKNVKITEYKKGKLFGRIV
ncbi:MAG: MiaB/RimO family radical SAM methylthiotransferase [bacterium]|nr:MiaB/RimO family radical SAM methylthiotransferase [bacterium]